MTRWFRSSALGLMVVLFSFYVAGCAPTVSIVATKNPAQSVALEPATFVIFEGNTGPEYTQPLQAALDSELRKKQISGRATIITGAEFNEGQILRYWASKSKAIVLIIPAGGTRNMDVLPQILYDVRVLEIKTADEVRPAWRARVDTKSPEWRYLIRARLELFAHDLVSRLVTDRVLPNRGSSKE